MRRPPRTRLRNAVAGALATALAGIGLAALPTTAHAAGGGLVVQYRTGSTAASASQAAPSFRVRNTGPTALPLQQVTLRRARTARPDARGSGLRP
ncbi:cellulose binding domain-containing protein, partial [Streptomyces sp. NPDC002454]